MKTERIRALAQPPQSLTSRLKLVLRQSARQEWLTPQLRALLKNRGNRAKKNKTLH